MNWTIEIIAVDIALSAHTGHVNTIPGTSTRTTSQPRGRSHPPPGTKIMTGKKRQISNGQDTTSPQKRQRYDISPSLEAPTAQYGQVDFFACPFYVRNPLVFFECRPRHRNSTPEPKLKTRSKPNDKPTYESTADGPAGNPTDGTPNVQLQGGQRERRENMNMFSATRSDALTLHLDRKHKAADLYCSRCGLQFGGDDQQRKFEEHCRADNSVCQPSTSQETIGISEAEMKQIKRAGKDAPAYQRWMNTWHILFGKTAVLRLKSAPRAIPGRGFGDIKEWLQFFGRFPPETFFEELQNDIEASIRRTVPVPSITPPSASYGPTSEDSAPPPTGLMPVSQGFQQPNLSGYAGPATAPPDAPRKCIDADDSTVSVSVSNIDPQLLHEPATTLSLIRAMHGPDTDSAQDPTHELNPALSSESYPEFFFSMDDG